MTATTSIDQKLIDAIAQRKPCDFSAGTDVDALDNSSQWGPDRTIDSAVLRKVLLDDKAGYGLAHQPLEITGARIVGIVDFRAASVPRPVYFVKCVFSDMIDCTGARLQTTSFENCKIGEFRARYAQFDGSLLLRHCQFSGGLDLGSASVARDVDLRGSKLSAQSPINADRLDVGGSIYLRDGFSSEARISLEGAEIASALDGIRGRFRNDNGSALFLNAAKIGGFCSLSFATIETKSGLALSAEGIQVGSFLAFTRSKVTGMLMLRDARIGANLNLAGVTLENSGENALNLERAKVAGDVLLNPHELVTKSGAERLASTVVGSIAMFNASIDGSLVIQDAEIDGDAKGIFSLYAEGLRVGMYLNLVRSRFKGLVMLRDAQVGRTINLAGVKIDNPGMTGLDLERAKVGGDVFIRPSERTGLPTEPALITGGIIMSASTIGGSVFIQDGSINNHKDERLLFNRMNVSGAFLFANITCGNGRLSFANAKVFAFNDEGTIWPKQGSLLLNGFEYNFFSGSAPTGWRSRLEWLRRYKPDEFNPQPFMTLVAVLRRAGYDRDAKRIAIARHREARRYMWRGSPRWLGSMLMGATCGHGYRPWLAAMWAMLFIGIGYVVFDLKPTEVVPLKEPAATQYHSNKMSLPDGYPIFQPLLYSADVLLPIVNLQQKEYWAPNATEPQGKLARLYLPLHVLAGWFFTTLFVVGVTGLIRRE
jgi:hypothetical protein